jgi:riboflavin synthase
MFTGIVEETGRVERVEDSEDGRRLRIGTTFADLEAGASVAVDGACLTVESFEPGAWFSVFLARETLDRTTFDAVREGDGVNLERAMPADGRFDGHVVQGHVDGTAAVRAVERVGETPASETSGASPDGDSSGGDSSGGDSSGGDWTYTFELPPELARYVVEKGSVTLDGISLTVARLDDDAGTFSVAIIPTTYRETTLSETEPGDRVHVEVDVLAKYVERVVATDDGNATGGGREELDGDAVVRRELDG